MLGILLPPPAFSNLQPDCDTGCFSLRYFVQRTPRTPTNMSIQPDQCYQYCNYYAGCGHKIPLGGMIPCNRRRETQQCFCSTPNRPVITMEYWQDLPNPGMCPRCRSSASGAQSTMATNHPSDQQRTQEPRRTQDARRRRIGRGKLGRAVEKVTG